MGININCDKNTPTPTTAVPSNNGGSAGSTSCDTDCNLMECKNDTCTNDMCEDGVTVRTPCFDMSNPMCSSCTGDACGTGKC